MHLTEGRWRLYNGSEIDLVKNTKNLGVSCLGVSWVFEAAGIHCNEHYKYAHELRGLFYNEEGKWVLNHKCLRDRFDVQDSWDVKECVLAKDVMEVIVEKIEISNSILGLMCKEI